MNAPEKHIVRLALFLLLLGIIVRFLPWTLPSIESFQVGDAMVVSATSESILPESPPEKPQYADKVKDALADEPYHKKSNFSKKAPKKVTLPVHVNTATVEELCALKGVGPKLAERIISVREASGPFKSGKDLEKVPGIGKKKLSDLLLGVIFD